MRCIFTFSQEHGRTPCHFHPQPYLMTDLFAVIMVVAVIIFTSGCLLLLWCVGFTQGKPFSLQQGWA